MAKGGAAIHSSKGNTIEAPLNNVCIILPIKPNILYITAPV